jgi:hypothetical protein
MMKVFLHLSKELEKQEFKFLEILKNTRWRLKSKNIYQERYGKWRLLELLPILNGKRATSFWKVHTI